VCGESRTHGVERGKRWKAVLTHRSDLTYRYPKHWIRFAPAAWWPLLRPRVPWTSSPRRCGNTSPSGRSCLAQSVCPTMPSAPMPAQRSPRTSSSCRSGIGLSTSSQTGCIWVRRQTAFRSTAISRRIPK